MRQKLRKVLFPVDFSPFTEMLLGCAEELVQVGMEEVVILHVIEGKAVADFGDHPSPGFAALEKQAREELEKLWRSTVHRDFQAKILVETGSPATAILDVARKEDVDLIIIGSHGKGFLSRLVQGSVSEKVMKLADRPVLIYECRIDEKEGGYVCEKSCPTLLGHLLVANDFSRFAEKVKPVLARFAQSFCTRVTLLHVQEGPTTYGRDVVTKARQKKAKDNLERLVEEGNYLGPYCKGVETMVVTGDPVNRILEIARDIGATMIVMGAVGRDEGHGDMVGSVTEKIVRRSEIPVLVLKA